MFVISYDRTHSSTVEFFIETERKIQQNGIQTTFLYDYCKSKRFRIICLKTADYYSLSEFQITTC